ncbi:MAG: septation protein SpoVG family protein [Candidatus Omnitrophica bacterium]|nr:septation protein SpoVG family protein [Candidatus Omnitrophota bacterium]
MEVTEIRIFPKQGQDKKLQAYATVTFDNKFVVRNIKVIQGSNGLFIAMPSRKSKAACPNCNFKNEVGSKFCNQCGKSVPLLKTDHTPDPKADHRDVAHPITQEFRDYLQTKILDAYQQEKVKGPSAYAHDDIGD